MYKDSLMWFFNNNGLDLDAAPPPAAHEHFRIKLLTENVQLQDIIDSAVLDRMPKRVDEVMDERSELESAATCDQIIRIMRRGTDIMNQHYLVNKALEFEDEIIPLIIKMLKTSLNDLFIEVSIRILAVCKQDIAEDLVSIFDDVRSPYAQSLILVALGFKGGETLIPWLIKKYNLLKQLYPDESHCYGAYYALLEMEKRFYYDSSAFSSEQSGKSQ